VSEDAIKRNLKDWYEEMAKDDELVARGRVRRDAVKTA